MKFRDQRFYQLIDMAREGDEGARADLFHAYEYDFDHEGDPRDQLPTRKETKPTKSQEK